MTELLQSLAQSESQAFTERVSLGYSREKDTTRIKKKFPPIAIIDVLTQKQADNSFVVHI